MKANNSTKAMPLARHAIMTLLSLAILAASCSKTAETPRPMGYLRIDLPDTSYAAYKSDRIPVSFDLSANAMITYKDSAPGAMDIVYPSLQARVYCDYKPVNGNLRQLSEDAYSFVMRHNVKAYAISPAECGTPEAGVYGLFYYISGRDVASPIQFVLTDSTRHFFRGALYFDCPANQDSLAPVVDYLGADVLRMIDSFRWE